jgi:hypothetical protein
VDLNILTAEPNFTVSGSGFTTNSIRQGELPVAGQIHENTWDADNKEFLASRIEANRLREMATPWQTIPTYCPPATRIDRLILNIIELSRLQAQSDSNPTEFTHAHFPSVSSLLNPALTEPDKPVASTIARHVASVIRVHTFPEKIAVSFLFLISDM